MSGARQWADTAIWWHVYPLGFVGADTSTNPHGEVVHGLPRVTAWLDDLLDLGCNGLLLGPVFDSETHGYDTIDHLRIDPRLGDDADADALFDACRQRGIRVLLDGVFNHVGRCHPWWQRGGRGRAGFGRPPRGSRPDPGAASVDGLEVQVFEGHESLVVLDHDDPEVAATVRDVMAHWLDRGVDGWRLDAAYAVPAGVLAHHHRAGARAVPRGVVRRRGHPRRLRRLRGGVGAGLAHPVRAVEGDPELDRGAQLVRAAPGPSSGTTSSPRRSCPLTFVGNHDVTRVASAIARPAPRRATPPPCCASWPAAPPCTPATSAGSPASRRSAPAGTTRCAPSSPATPTDWPRDEVFHRHQEAISFRRRHPWLARARVGRVGAEQRVGAAHGDRVPTASRRSSPSTCPTARSSSAGRPVPAHGWTLT